MDLSIVIPIFNEEDSIRPLHAQLKETLEGLDLSYEIIVVDDGSTDRSFAILRDLHTRDRHLKVIRFRRNFGQTAAFAAGFDHCQGDLVITMDADLQNDPADIPLLLGKVDEGYDVVSGWRVNRQDAFLTRRLPSVIANWFISKVTGVHLHDYGCSLKAYRREVIQSVHLYGELHRFVPALASWMGVSVAEIPVRHHARHFGESKYGISRTARVILDLMTVRFLLSYSTRPIQIFGGLGLLSFALGIGLGGYLSFVKLALGQDIGNRPLLLLAILLTVLGVQLITMGLLGELVVRTYYEAQGKRIYAVRELLAREEDAGSTSGKNTAN
ncbi:MAG TPA: glycosyltransferase family 2 protein [Anaerolineae bacterium]|nr:glycosyltransferase family 2 protein [Anaerolineae bacterium]